MNKTTPYGLTINQLVQEAHRCSREHGWWDAQKLPDSEILDPTENCLDHALVESGAHAAKEGG